MVGFIFGGSTGETPESIKRKRAIAQALLRGSTKTPESVGEAVGQGLSGLGDALVYRSLNSQADKGEADGKASAAADRAAFLSTYGLDEPSTGTRADIGSPAAATELAATSPKVGSTFTPFIDTVKAGGLTNPYGLAAVAATGERESGWSPEKAVQTWSDPSESGKPGTAGGVMSWRGPRYQALAATGDLSPEGQAKFFLQENPDLIAGLNNAKSVEEAQSLINKAWAFAGYDRPGGEAARRLSLAQGYLPQFQGGNQVASLDPAAGMTTAAGAIDTIAPPSGAVAAEQPAFDPGRWGDPIKLSEMPASRADLPSGLQAQAGAVRSPVANALVAPQSAAPQSAAQPSSSVASALMGTPAAGGELAATTGRSVPSGGVTVAQALGNGPSVQQAFRLLNNPYATEADRAIAMSVIERQQKTADPDYQLGQEIKREQLNALRAKPQKNWQKLDDTTLFNPDTGETQRVGGAPAGSGAFRFEGKSVEAQALNGLMEAGQLTPAQAQQLGAGKTITGPNGEIMFLTPQGVFGQPAGGGAAQPVAAPVPAQGAQPPVNPQPMAEPAPASVDQPRSGMIPLTEPRVTIDESKAAGFADRMTESGKLIDKFGNAGLSTFDQTVTNSPYIPGFIANNVVGDDFQKYDQARRDFINAQLRRESGAVISDEEFDNANKQYFPQPGDKQEVLEQKRRARETVINSMKRDAGPTYGKGAKAKETPKDAPDFSKMTDEELRRLVDGK